MNIVLPYLPPSLNCLYRARGSRIYKSARYTDFQKKVAADITADTTFKGNVHLDVVFHIKNKKKCCDLDNYLKCLIDSLQDNGVIDNDKNIVKITASRHLNCEQDKTVITLHTFPSA